MRYFACLLLIALLSGCGQMGPLYMPGEPAQTQDSGADRSPDDATND